MKRGLGLCATPLAFALAWAGVTAPAHADEPAATEVFQLTPLEVLGTRVNPPSTQVTDDVAASPASVTVINKTEIDRKTVNTYGDLFRGVGGINILEYGQGLVAYGISVRGFDESHGRNLAVFLDGMPLNVTGSQHTNGYMDLAQLIPELVSRAEIVRGPFSVFAGNHAVGGSVQLYTDASAPSSVKFTLDQFGRARVLPVLNREIGPGSVLIAFDGTKGEGYTDQSDLERLNLFARYELPLTHGIASFRVQAYDADAEAPGWIDADKVRSGEIGKRDALSKGIGDAKTQQNLVFNYRSSDPQGASGAASGWSASLYFANDIRKRWTNFDLSTPIGASVPLNQERDRLHQIGADVRKTVSFATAGRPSQLVVGLQLNDEDIDARRFQTDGDQRPTGLVDTDRSVHTFTQALLAQYQVQPVKRLKLTLGARYDRLAYDVDLHSDDASFSAVTGAGLSTSVSKTLSQFSPKLGAAVTIYETPTYRGEVFANAARGLKSPYPFADFFANAGGSNTSDLSISSLKSYELGVQGSTVSGTSSWRASLWNTRQDREADRNAVGVFQDFKKTDRDGFDLEASTLIAGKLRLYANHSHVKARIKNPVSASADHIPNVPERTSTLGLIGISDFGAHRLEWSLANSWIGPQSITSDDSVRTKSFNRYTAQLTYQNAGWHGARAFLSLVGYDKQAEELVFDFGGGLFGTSVKPKLRVTAGVQIPLGGTK